MNVGADCPRSLAPAKAHAPAQPGRGSGTAPGTSSCFRRIPPGCQPRCCAPETAGWPMLDRYRSVFATLNSSCTSTIRSFSGTRATGAAWLRAAESSSSAWDVPGDPPCDRSGAWKFLQPSAGPTKSVEQRVVAAVGHLGSIRQPAHVRRIELGGPPAGGEQIAGGHVVAGVLIDEAEAPGGGRTLPFGEKFLSGARPACRPLPRETRPRKTRCQCRMKPGRRPRRAGHRRSALPAGRAAWRRPAAGWCRWRPPPVGDRAPTPSVTSPVPSAASQLATMSPTNERASPKSIKSGPGNKAGCRSPQSPGSSRA